VVTAGAVGLLLKQWRFLKARAERRYRVVVMIIVMLPTTKQSITAITAVTSTQPLPA
jgi:hypothetical protein